ncbi:MAG: cation:proton antiporter [Aquificaceae bacterium]
MESNHLISLGLFLFSMFAISYMLKGLKVPFIVSFMLFGLIGKGFFDRETVGYFFLFENMAIILLFFFLGLEYSFERLFGMTQVWKPGLVDFLLNFLPFSVVAYILTRDTIFSVFLSAALYPSSTAIVAKLLVDYRRLINPEADLLLGLLIFEDLICIILLSALVPVSLGSDLNPLTALISFLYLVVFFTFFYLFDRYGKLKVFPVIEILSKETVFIFFILGVLFLSVGFSKKVGISEVLVAFLLGVLVPENTNFYRAIERELGGLKELSLGIFFFFFTYKTSVEVEVSLLNLVLLFILAFVLKGLSTFLSGLLYGLSGRVSFRAALSFLSRGEFSLVFAAYYVPVQSYVFFVVLFTSILGSFSFVLSPWLVQKLFPRRKASKVPLQAP